MKQSNIIILFDEIKNNLPNGFYEDIHGNYCCAIGKYMIVIRVETKEYSEPIIVIELLSCLYGYFDNVNDYYAIYNAEEVSSYISDFIEYIIQH